MEGLQLSNENPKVDINDMKKRGKIGLKEHTNRRSSKYSDIYRLRIVCVLSRKLTKGLPNWS